MAVRALLWDVDGTLAESERDGHRVAFNRAFAEAGLDWEWGVERYGELLAVTGGRERLLHDMASRAGAPPTAEREALAANLHARKNRIYAGIVGAGAIALRPGVAELLDECEARGVGLAIATTTSRENVEALLGATLGAGWQRRFAAVVCGEDVSAKKPDPEVYELLLESLGLSPVEAVAIEDSPGGVAAARGAGLSVVVTRSAYFPDATIEEAIAIGPGFHRRDGWRPAPEAPGEGRIVLDDLVDWHARNELTSAFG